MSILQVSSSSSGNVGRPKFDIACDQLQHLLQNGFSVPDIANLLDVSVRRRMTCFGLSVRETYSQISDDELEDLVREIQQDHPNWGNRLMYGCLLAKGIQLPHQRVREVQSRIDPEGSIMRRLRFLNRRKYSVRGPQWLWHMDGNHKLIRY